MTSPGKLDQVSGDRREPPRHTRRQPVDRSFLHRHKSAGLRITLSLIALAGASAALIAVVGTGSHQPTSGGTSAATAGAPTAGSIKASPVNQAAPNSTSKAKGKVGSAAQVPSAAQVAESGGALSLPANMRSRVMAWQFGPGGTHLAAVTRQFGDALQAAGARQYFQMKSACTQLAHSVSAAEAGPRIPVAAMQQVYGQALTELAKGAADCQAAITTKPGYETLGTKIDATILKRSRSELGIGAKDIFRSTAEIEIASRQHH